MGTRTLLDSWQQVLAQDARFSHVRPPMCDSRPMRALYLRRRHQLSKELSQVPKFGSGGSSADRERYRLLREQVLVQLYGDCGSLHNSFGSSNLTKSTPDGSRDCPSVNASCLGAYESPSGDRISYRSLDQFVVNNESFTGGYAFSGIDHIFDHHTKAINRLRFANNDNTRLAVASADGTISLCSSWPPECEKHVIVHLTGGHRFGASVSDVLWSLTNEFLVSTAVDGSVCVWDSVTGSLKRHYSSQSLNLGPAMVCAFQPQNYNLLVVGGGWGVVQILNLSTGKAIRKGRDHLHFQGISHSQRQPSGDARLLEFNCTGRGSITALTFEEATGKWLWVGTDRGIIQSYNFETSSGGLTRAHRIDLASIYSSFHGDPNTGLEGSTSEPPIQPDKSLKLLAGSSFRRKLSNLQSTIRRAHRSYPSITSLSFHSWLSLKNDTCYLLGNAAGIGLLLFEVTLSSGGNLTLKRQFPIPHRPFGLNSQLRLIHCCLAPLMSMNSGAYAITGSEDSNVYIFDVLVQDPDNTAGRNSTTRSGLVTVLQGHTAPVLDVAIGWDESVLASGDESGSVIIWRRIPK